MSTQDRIVKVLSQVFDAETSEITQETHLASDLGAESIDFLDITFRLEREFEIKISREALGGLAGEWEGDLKDVTVGQLVDFVDSFIKQSDGALKNEPKLSS